MPTVDRQWRTVGAHLSGGVDMRRYVIKRILLMFLLLAVAVQTIGGKDD